MVCIYAHYYMTITLIIFYLQNFSKRQPSMTVVWIQFDIYIFYRNYELNHKTSYNINTNNIHNHIAFIRMHFQLLFILKICSKVLLLPCFALLFLACLQIWYTQIKFIPAGEFHNFQFEQLNTVYIYTNFLCSHLLQHSILSKRNFHCVDYLTFLLWALQKLDGEPFMLALSMVLFNVLTLCIYTFNTTTIYI